MKLIGGAAVLAAALLFTGCGSSESAGPSAAEKASASEKAAQEKAAQEREEAAAERKAKQTATYRECRGIVGPLNKQLASLNSRLSVGLSFDEHVGLGVLDKPHGSARYRYGPAPERMAARDCKALGVR